MGGEYHHNREGNLSTFPEYLHVAKGVLSTIGRGILPPIKGLLSTTSAGNPYQGSLFGAVNSKRCKHY